ncbi:MAG: right-handed parallel beta-helix repeat-containing protein [Pseudomonadota bacterium]
MATYTVTTAQDEAFDADETVGSPDGTGLSLREPIGLAAASPGADRIVFDTPLLGSTFTLTGGVLALADAAGVTIDGDINGDGIGDVTISGNSSSGVFSVTSGTARLDALTITGGSAAAGAGINVASGANLTLTASEVTGNTTTGTGSGGGIFVQGTLNAVGSTIANNSSVIGGGVSVGASGDATFVNTTFHNNSSGQAGGAISNAGTLALSSSTVTGNSTSGSGGGLFDSSSQLTITNTILAGNNAASGSGTEDIAGTIDTASGVNIFGQLTVAGAGTNDIAGAAVTDVFAGTATINGVVAGVLADNGGPVETVLIQRGGTADAAGDASALPTDTADIDSDTDTSELLPLDARGASRVSGSGFDVGAVEAGEAPSLIVTTLTDVVDNRDGQTSLREAIAFANSQTGADTITFAAGLSGTLRLTQGELVITDAVTVDGGGLITITGDAADDDVTDANDITDVAASGAAFLTDNSRVFNITASTAATTLSGLTITGGRTTADTQYGGGVRSVANLTLVGSTVAGNSTAGYDSYGGGIFSRGTVTLANSTVSGNSTEGVYAAGGGVYAPIVRGTNTTISGNSTAGADADGGGIYSRVTTELTNSTVSGNSTSGASAKGGGIYSTGQSGGGIGLTNSIVLGNTTTGSGVDGDEISVLIGSNTPFTGGNIVGTNIFNGATDVGDTTAEQVFAATVTNNGVLAGALGDNGGSVQTIALRPGGDAVGRGDATLLPADTFDLDNDGVTAETLPIDATGGPRVDGTVDLGAVEAREAPSLIVTTLTDVVDGGGRPDLVARGDRVRQQSSRRRHDHLRRGTVGDAAPHPGRACHHRCGDRRRWRADHHHRRRGR